MKEDFGNHAVCTEQGASVSHLTAAKALNVISRLPGCSGQATDAVSAYTQVGTRTGSSIGRGFGKDSDQSTESKRTAQMRLN